MAISDRIQAMYTHTSDIYDSVELTGVDTTDIDKNLVNVPNTLKEGYIDIINNGTDTLYNNFPKVSGEGTSLTLNNTYQAPMRNNLKGNTSQTGTPTPTSPIPVNVVSGDNTINVIGKNLFGGFEFSRSSASVTFATHKDGSITMSGTSTATTYSLGTSDILTYKKTLVAGTYTLSGGTSSINLVLTDSSGTNLCNTNRANSVTFTLNSDTDIVVRANVPNGTVTNTTVYPMLSTSGGDYEPYQGNTYNIDLPVENLFDKNTTNILNGYISATGFNSYANNRTIYIPTIVGQTYTIQKTIGSGNLLYAFTENTPAIGTQTLLGRTDASSKIATVTAPTNGNYLSITIYRDADNSFTVDEVLGGLQIEKGSKVNSYTPYGTKPIELCKIGTYQDQFKKATGKNLAPINLESETYNSLQITNNDNGTFTLLGNPTGSFGRDIATNLTLKAGTYTISANAIPSGLYIALDNEADTQLSNGTLSKTFTLASDTTYTSLGIWFTKNKDYDVTIKLQIEEGSSVTEWQPMNGWYLHKEIGKVILNGSETWNIFNSNNTRTAFRKDINDIEGYTNGNNTPNLTSNRFTPISYNGTWSIGNLSRLINNNAQTALILVYSPNTSVEDLQTWLSSNNVLVYYVLATPTSEGIPTNLINQLEELYIAQSKNNQTNISQINNDLGFIISASALKKGV